ncbi:MAG TPA: outer membrane beta-barrel protein, partial [Chitinophagaceae bacterium]|nr:outer membrane beta-barrel protein [Chitinophagaceae bacterium]
MKSSRSLRSLLILLLFCAIHVAGFAQNKASISGNVKDSLQKPLAFVTVSLFKQADPVNAIKSTYTNDKGKFSFNQLDTGSYKLIISHTGFSERSESITVSESQNELKDLILSPASKTLAGVSVNARKPLIEQTDDKIIFNAENDPTSKSERAIDLLRKTPFVSVDGDDNILVNGQSNFKVLLNGRETAMFAQNVKEAMKGFPGSLIVKIEVITSPGAKYDGEGVGGVINIITKKKVAGYNGSLNLYAATSGWNNINANFSVKSGKFGFTMFYGAGGTPGVNGKYFSQTIPSIASFYTKRTIMGDRRMINFWQNGNAELSYEIDSLNTLSAYGNINGGTFRTKNNQTITTEFPSDPPTTSLYNLDNKNQFPNISLGTDYIRKFKENKEKEFSIRVNAEIGKSNTFSTSSQDNPGTNDRFINNTSIAQNKQYTIQSDLIQPMKNNQKIEVGVKAILRRATSDFRSLIRYESEIDFKVNPGNTDYFKYDQNVYSIYSTYSFKVKKTTFRLGLRVENTGIDGNFVSSNTKVKQDYTTLLPNIQSTTKLSNTFTLVLSYSKRLQRPFIWNLNPFVNNNDSLNISFGNPGLDPQTINSVSVQTRIMKGPFFA